MIRSRAAVSTGWCWHGIAGSGPGLPCFGWHRTIWAVDQHAGLSMGIRNVPQLGPHHAASNPMPDGRGENPRAMTQTSSASTVVAVLVHYGNHAAARRFERTIRDGWPSTKVVIVDTASVDVPHLNRAFEFSGYRHGIEIAVRETMPGQTLRVLLCNDTIFTAHDGRYVRAVLSALHGAPVEGRAILGCAENIPPAAPTACKWYFPTFLFAVQGTPADLLSLSMHDGVFENAQTWEETWSALPTAYRLMVDRWLKPTSFLKGWYQAIPGRQLPLGTLFRKRFAIFQEHTLVGRAQDSGFVVIDLCTSHPLLKFGRLKDRIRGNLHKWLFRLSSVLKPRTH